MYLTKNPCQTRKLGKRFAKKALKSPRKRAFVIGLIGDLGGGKTTFLQGFAEGLGIKGRISSPTFVIMKRYKNFYHFDCHRIKKPKELLELGFNEIISNPQNIVALEWVDRVQKILPEDALILKFEFIDDKTRKINF